MAWIKTIPFTQADEALREALEAQRKLYPRSTRATRATTAARASSPPTR